MRIFIEKDYDAMSRRMAQIIAAEITHNPACVLGLATGSTPEGAYKYLVDWHNLMLPELPGRALRQPGRVRGPGPHP